MKPKKVPLILLLIVLVLGYLLLQILFPFLSNNITSNDNNCPQYIKDFVQKYPQAKELQTNYTNKSETPIIELPKPEGIPLYMQWDQRWAYNPYGDEIIGTAGCGPTCLSMVAVGLTGNTDYNP